MKELLLIYVAVQALSTAWGLTVIESIKPIAKNKLESSDYVKMNKHSLYNFNDGFSSFLKGLIPFYYAAKAVSLISSKDPIDKEAKNQIQNGEYISLEDKLKIEESEQRERELAVESLAVSPKVYFEKPDKYVARKNDNSLYDINESPIEYITRETSKESELSLTPYVGDDKVVEHKIVKDEVTNSDIAKAITLLNVNELEMLRRSVDTLIDKRKNKTLTLRDVA